MSAESDAEPTAAEYDALGRAVLGRALRGDRRRRGARLVLVGLSAAAVTAIVLVGGAALPSGSPLRQEAIVSEAGAVESPAPADAGSVVCSSSADRSADTVTISRGADHAGSTAGRAVAECSRVWRAGVFGSTGDATEALGGPEAAPGVAESLPATPVLVPCRIGDGTTVVVPSGEESRTALCRRLDGTPADG